MLTGSMRLPAWASASGTVAGTAVFARRSVERCTYTFPLYSLQCSWRPPPRGTVEYHQTAQSSDPPHVATRRIALLAEERRWPPHHSGLTSRIFMSAAARRVLAASPSKFHSGMSMKKSCAVTSDRRCGQPTGDGRGDDRRWPIRMHRVCSRLIMRCRCPTCFHQSPRYMTSRTSVVSWNAGLNQSIPTRSRWATEGNEC
jgi:hypothetical protein